ncbi:response regulator transcription factor [Caulobacter sp. UNC279MFTsu5.1]|uniref:response regulator n=1 Tax=Caulobacter sp. UNC279MFTsu5.1 TaxID=1502775 RepID=UPI0003717408|nr:response regulator transcription factor [Caulobacter sp. UNC279MFTsu5.1]SFK00122.1 DNA-binding response regulator, NarL/FixJ family, contains REC and HTH domains [Caulobacter sp. UNC279MFTsu5.1]
MDDSVTANPIRVMIVDDHPMLRDGVVGSIKRQPDMVVAAEAGDGAAAIAAIDAANPDVVLMDLQMPGIDGVEAIQTISRKHPQVRILVLTTYFGDAKALRALKAGANGYLLKSAMRTDLIDAIRAVHGGGRHIPPEVATQIAVHAIGEAPTEREIEILSLVAAGNPNKQIARRLGISEDTVKAHLKRIFAKLGVADRTHAVTVAAKRGIIEL